MTTNFLFLYLPFIFLLCSHFVLEKLVILIGSEHQSCHVPPISPFSQRNLYFGILGHALKPLLGHIFPCFGRKMVLGPTLNRNSFTFTASTNFCRHSRALIVSYATHFTICSKKPVFWYLVPFSKAFVGPNISLFWQENGVGTHFEQQLFLVHSTK